MANMTITNFETAGTLILDSESFRDEVLTFAGADTFKKGTILARSSVTGKLVPYAVGGANGSGTPVAVLTYDVTRGSAGDETIRAMVAGRVNKNRLIIDADGDGSNITNAILDALRGISIIPIDVAMIGGGYDTQD